MNNNKQLFEAKNIVTGYEKKIIIDGIDITIPSNKISVIIGSNGCGKSTLLKTLARLIKPVSGDIVIDGKKITSMPSKQLAKVFRTIASISSSSRRYNSLGFSFKGEIPISILL